MHDARTARAAHRALLPFLFHVLVAGALLWAALHAAAVHAADRSPPALRLGDDVRPVAYELTLRIDPRQEDFSGRVAIDVDLARPLQSFWLNGTRLAVQRAVLQTAAGPLAATTTTSPDNEFVGVQLPRQAPAGRARLLMEFSGRMSSLASRGLFRQQDLGEWYAFSQFESTNARKAFPCFDEPHWKTPWTVKLEIPRGQVAVSNMPEAAREALPDGWDRVRFAATPPLPSYLVAFGVGPFEIVDGGRAGRKQTPVRFIVPKGRSAEARFAREATPRLLALLEDYFGMPYPFAKLDSMAIPLTLSFGAMENPGLITYRSNFLLADAQREDERFRQTYASIGAHEMAHQWFGDLVTMRWWDDIWLNESFATWMADKIRSRFNPGWETGLRREQSRQEAFDVDRLPSARQVRQPVLSRDDLANAFDHITYSKGGALLRMYEARIGEDAFRDGVRRYLASHAFGNATAEDFFAAIGQTDPLAARSFHAFVQQPGLPLVDVEVDCAAHVPVAHLRQQRFLPGAAKTTAQTWLLPVCLRTDAGERCTMLQQPQEDVQLPARGGCQAWVLPNPAGRGYFLTRLDAAAMRKLAAAPLQPLEAIALVGEQAQLARSGALPLDDLFALLSTVARDARPDVLAAAAEAAGSLHPALFTPAQREQRPAWIRATFGAAAHALGWRPRASESDAQRKLRAVLLPLVADEGEDAELAAEARRLADAWLDDEHATLGGQWREPMLTAAHYGDAAFQDKVVAVIRRTPERRLREDLWGALAHARDERLLERAFAIALDPGWDFRESAAVYKDASEVPAAASALLRFYVAHEAELLRRTPEELLASRPRLNDNICTPAERDTVAALWGPGKPTPPGRARSLALALEQIDVCLRARALAQAR